MPPRIARQSDESIEAEVRGDYATDIARRYDAPFPIYSEEEGERYRDLLTKSIEVPTYFDFQVLDQIGLTDILMTLCRRGSWEDFVRMSYPVYRELTLEFFTSLRFAAKKPNKLWFRLRGQVYYMDEGVLRLIFGFAENDMDDAHQSFNTRAYWKNLTNLDEYDPHIASNADIIHPEFKLLHKFMCGVIFGKRQSTKCSMNELFLLWCIQHGHKPNMFVYVSKSLIDVVGRKGIHLGMGYVATAVAEWFRVDLSQLNMLKYHFFDVPYLTRSQIIADKTMKLRDHATRSASRRRLAAGEGSSKQLAVECGVEHELPPQQPQPMLSAQHEHGQQSQPDLAMVYQQLVDVQKLVLENQVIMVENHTSTQKQLDQIHQQMHLQNQRMRLLTNRVQEMDVELQSLRENKES